MGKGLTCNLKVPGSNPTPQDLNNYGDKIFFTEPISWLRGTFTR